MTSEGGFTFIVNFSGFRATLRTGSCHNSFRSFAIMLLLTFNKSLYHGSWDARETHQI